MDLSQTTLETKRLSLRSFDINDARAVQKFAVNFDVAKTTLYNHDPYEERITEAWIETHEKRWTEEGLVNFAIVNKQTSQLLGVVGLVGRRDKEGGIGYWIGEPFWGKGYCTEATKALIDFCFKSLNIKRLEAEYLVTNPASGRVMEKAGMKYKCSKMIKDRKGNNAELYVYEIIKDQ